MAKQYIDEFSKLSVDKMAQGISDMTYAYNNTIIPKKHYKDLLSKSIMEIASSDLNMEMCLLQPYINMLTSMSSENRKYFIKALLITELKIKDSAQEVLALSKTWDYIEDKKMKCIINSEIIEMYKAFKDNINIEFDNNESNNYS